VNTNTASIKIVVNKIFAVNILSKFSGMFISWLVIPADINSMLQMNTKTGSIEKYKKIYLARK
jgi:hypothetical protein